MSSSIMHVSFSVGAKLIVGDNVSDDGAEDTVGTEEGLFEKLSSWDGAILGAQDPMTSTFSTTSRSEKYPPE